MSSGPSNVNHGTAGGTPINVDYTPRLEHGAPVKVQLSANYITVRSPGMPTRPSLTGCAVASLDYPKTISSGTVLTLLKGEADALVAAGKASYV